MSLEMAHKVPQKKIMSRSFLNSGTLIVISTVIFAGGGEEGEGEGGREDILEI